MRYIPNTKEQRAQMLEALGLSSVEGLFSCIPEDVRFKGKLNLPEALSEMELVSHMQALADSDLNL
ncbi:MAG: glycine dehydrogenase, partial [Synergistales bacterium]|nr:glycine dehydrogenase [Synergistales bacterium]